MVYGVVMKVARERGYFLVLSGYARDLQLVCAKVLLETLLGLIFL